MFTSINLTILKAAMTLRSEVREIGNRCEYDITGTDKEVVRLEADSQVKKLREQDRWQSPTRGPVIDIGDGQFRATVHYWKPGD